MSAPGQAVYEARMEAVWGSDWELAEPAYGDLSAPDRASWEDTARLLGALERPAPARADEFARMKVKLSALVASMEDTVRPRPDAPYDDISREFDDGAVHATVVTLRQLRAILDETALTAGVPQPAPELAAAMREARLYREALAQVASMAEAKGAVRQVSNIAKVARNALEGK